MGSGAENVNHKKIKKIVMVAKKYAYDNRLLNNRIRFDVIEVNIINDGIKINHIKNVII